MYIHCKSNHTKLHRSRPTIKFLNFCMSHDKGLNIIIMEFHRHWTRCTTNSQVFDAFLNPNNMLEKLTQWGESPHSLICTVLLFQNEKIVQKEAIVLLHISKNARTEISKC